MKKIISKEKMSKKARKELNAQARSTWGVTNPVTRIVPNGKGYNRAKEKARAYAD